METVAGSARKVIFGAKGDFCFYVESQLPFHQVDPWFVHVAHGFLGLALRTMFGEDSAGLVEYLRGIKQGEDPAGVLLLEPLVRSMITTVPDVVRQPTYAQLAEALARITSQAPDPL